MARLIQTIRNILRYETILSGDLNGDDIPCDVNTNRGDNSSVVVTGTEPDDLTPVDLTAILDGFTITGANGTSGIYLNATAKPIIQSCKLIYNKTSGGLGAGIHCSQNASPWVLGCTIEGNVAKFAGGIYLSTSANALIDSCHFVRNSCADFGGGIYLDSLAEPSIQNCTFESNTGAGGGAMFINTSGSLTRPIITDCKFINNEVTLPGGAGGGGAITNNNAYPFTITNCLFIGNKSHNTNGTAGGGAVLNTFGATNQFVNCAFSRNTADGYGGAIYNKSTLGATTLTLVNCSFSNNAATTNGGGVRGGSQASLVIRNSLFWGNTGSDTATLDKQISTAGPTPTVSYSSIEGCSGCFSGGTGNNGNPPSFVNATSDNLRLQSSSLVIDSADNCTIAGSVSADLDGTGHDRRIDYSTTDTGNDACHSPATTTYLDRGAYEFNSALDCNSNGRNDNADIVCGGGNNCGGTDGSYDCNHDGIPDECLAPCIKGDINHDGLVNGQDIQSMVTRLLGASTCVFGDCETDVNSDNAVDIADIPCFANVLMGVTACAYTCPPAIENLRSPDCNSNEINDANDIADGTSQDCNNNFIPDECDINTNDPDGNELVSADVNGNSVPDECEPDCNANSIPDAWDITQMTSTDVNTNGIPDECEKDCNENGRPDDSDTACGGGNTCNGIAGSYDCNLNGTPDECEADCNANGVPDDCDIDPTDPDGDTIVSEDCNDDGMPDECNLTLPPPFGSFDCNENGTLDECDIASEFSEDANANGVPDECESGQMMAPSGNQRHVGSAVRTMTDDDVPPTPNVAMMLQAPNQDAAWEALYEWALTQCWGPDCHLSPSEQFQAYLNKRAELGLTMP